MLATKNNNDKVMESPAGTNTSNYASTSEMHAGSVAITSVAAAVTAAVNATTQTTTATTTTLTRRTNNSTHNTNNNATVKKFTSTTLQKVRKKKLLGVRTGSDGDPAAAAQSVYRRPAKPVVNISRDLSENISQVSLDASGDSASKSSSASSTACSLDATSSSSLSDIDLEIERIEQKIRLKERRLLPGMLHKTRRQVGAPVEPGKVCHAGWLRDEDAQKKELYNQVHGSKRALDFFNAFFFFSLKSSKNVRFEY